MFKTVDLLTTRIHWACTYAVRIPGHHPRADRGRANPEFRSLTHHTLLSMPT
jgi:hypothetical protein